jgi:hypothetical protein
MAEIKKGTHLGSNDACCESFGPIFLIVVAIEVVVVVAVEVEYELWLSVDIVVVVDKLAVHDEQIEYQQIDSLRMASSPPSANHMIC